MDQQLIDEPDVRKRGLSKTTYMQTILTFWTVSLVSLSQYQGGGLQKST